MNKYIYKLMYNNKWAKWVHTNDILKQGGFKLPNNIPASGSGNSTSSVLKCKLNLDILTELLARDLPVLHVHEVDKQTCEQGPVQEPLATLSAGNFHGNVMPTVLVATCM